jgi:hypothetical protein
MSKKEPKILILGGGLGGLSCAHELARCGLGHNVTLLEKNDKCGGLARSGEIPQTGKDGKRNLPTEICWRIVGSEYLFMRTMLKQIPSDDPTKTVHDKLVDIVDYRVTTADGKEFIMNNGHIDSISKITDQPDMPKKDTRKILNKYLQGLTSCRERLDSYDSISWEDFLGPLTKGTHTWAVKSLGPFLGVDIYKVNASSILKIMEGFSWNSKKGAPLSVFGGPTNEIFIDPWAKHLRQEGVKIFTETPVIGWTTTDERILSVSTPQKTFHVDRDFDIVICSLAMETTAKLSKAPPLQSHLFFRKLPILADIGKQEMVGMQFYFTEKIDIPPTGIYLPDTPWQLIIEPWGKIWSLEISETYGDGTTRDIWSIGLDDPYAEGILIKKKWTDCTEEEIFIEAWYQIMTLSNLADTKTESGKNLIELGFQYAAIWPILNPKFSSNINSFKLKPTVETPLNNLYFATAYTRVTQEMYLMDVAFEAGTKAAWKVMESYKHPYTPSQKNLKRAHTPRAFSWLMNPMRAVDYFSYKNGGTHPSSWFGGSSITFIVIIWLIILALIALGIVIIVYTVKWIVNRKNRK